MSNYREPGTYSLPVLYQNRSNSGAKSPNKVKQKATHQAVRAEKRAAPATNNGKAKTRPVVLNQQLVHVDKTAQPTTATVAVVITFTEPASPAPRRRQAAATRLVYLLC